MFHSLVKRSQPHLLSVLLLLIATFAVYGRVLGHDFLMTWDDRLYVVHNEAIQGFSWQHIKTVFSNYYVGNYAPVQMLSYIFDYELWGLRAGGFLFTNLLIHIFNGFIVYRLLFKCHASVLLATVGAAIFLIHPVQVESVAWVSQRKNLLAMFFFLLAWEAYIRYRNAAAGKKMAVYTASITAFLLSLLAKSVAIIFPLVVVMYDLSYPAKDNQFRFLDKVPYFLSAVLFAALTIHSQQPVDDGWGGGVGGGLTGYHGGSIFATFLTMLTVFCRYIGMILWPFALSAAYEPAIHRTINPSVIGAIILLSGVCIVSARLFKHDRKVGFWAVIFFVGLLPVSQIIPLVTLMNDRYLYFPMLGASALIGYSTMFFGEKLSPRYKQLLRIFLVLLLILLSTVSFRRVAVWHDDISVGRDTVTKSPTQHSIWEGLGEAYYFAKPQQPLEALNAFTRALELDPTNKLTLYNLGVLYLERGDYDSSYELLNKLVYFYPDHAVGWACLGDIYAYRENYLEAEKTYLQALALKPDTERAIVGLKNLAIIRGPFNTLR